MKTISHLEFVVHSYVDNKSVNGKIPTNATSAAIHIYVDHMLYDCQMFSATHNLNNQPTKSNFELELELIFGALLQTLPLYSSNLPIKISFNETNIPKIIERVELMVQELTTPSGKRLLDDDLDKVITYLIYDRRYFNHTNKSIDTIKRFLSNILPILKHLDCRQLKLECVKYKPVNTDKEHPTKFKYWRVSNEVRHNALTLSDELNDLTKEEILANIKIRQSHSKQHK